MKLKATVFALFAAGLLAGLTLIAPAGADTPATTTGSTTTGTTTVSTTTTAPSTTTTPTTTTTPVTTTTPTSTGGAQDAITALSSTSITVGPLTCSISPTSPAITFHVGDRVRIGCENGVLLYIVAASPPPAPAPQPGAPAVFGFSPQSGGPGTTVLLSGSGFTGALAVRFYGTSADYVVTSDTSITAHVPVGATSGPITVVSPTAGDVTSSTSFTVNAPSGATGTTGTTPPSTVGHDGVITSLSATSITVDALTCDITPATSPNPATYGFAVGDTVGVYCQSGVLIKIIALPGSLTAPGGTTTTTQPLPPSDLQTRLGTIVALSATSITVDDLTCSISSSSPSTASFAIGDSVGIGCSNGVLLKIGMPADGGGGFAVAVRLGTIATLSSDLIRVGGLACELATTSPSVTNYSVGERVGIGCAGGILFMIGALPSTAVAPASTVQHALMQRFNGCVKAGKERCTVAGVVKRLVDHKR